MRRSIQLDCTGAKNAFFTGWRQRPGDGCPTGRFPRRRRVSPPYRMLAHVACRTSHHATRRMSRAPLPYWGNHPRPPPNKYNASFGKKCVAITHATFFVTFDDFAGVSMQGRCNWPVRRRTAPNLRNMAAVRLSHGRLGRADARPSRGNGMFFHGQPRRRRVSPPYRTVAHLSAGLLISLLSFLSLESLSLSSLKSLSSQPRGHHRQPSPTGMTARTEPRPPVRFLTGTKAECPENP